uniref:SLBP_RNA_bind domain-containing protein n=1 Tax=Macrostomum lignano TaxID=282301 RepID=A0A1I8F8C3_9PLAT
SKVCGMAATIDNEDDGDMNQALESQRSIQDGVEDGQGKRSSGLQLPAKYSDFVKDWAKEMRYSTTNIRQASPID